MPSTKTYTGVSQATFDCTRAKSIVEHGTVYSPTEGNKGRATTVKLGQKVVMGFDFDAVAETVTYTILEKGFLVPERSIWSGIEESIADCKS